MDKFIYFWLIIFVGILFLSFVDAGDQRICLEWDANIEENLAGYNIYVSFDAGGPYELIGTNDKDNTEFCWYGILTGNEYYFVVTAFNDEAEESGYSNEVCGYINFDKDYGVECGTEYDDPETEDRGGSSGKGCFIETLYFPL